MNNFEDLDTVIDKLSMLMIVFETCIAELYNVIEELESCEIRDIVEELEDIGTEIDEAICELEDVAAANHVNEKGE